ncbi:MAG: lactate utilization protein [Nitrospirae bacterium]|nr:lactate utilization protein [Nitrospirota bacterium]
MNFDEILTLRKVFKSVKERQKKNILPDFGEKVKKLRAVRALSVGNNELLNNAVRRMEENGIKVFHAKGRDDAIRIIVREIGDEKLVVKSKSNVTRELDLGKELESKGVKVIETDIGDRIAQILQCKPSHPTGPVAHISTKTIAAGLAEHYGITSSEDPQDIVGFLRDEICSYIEKAHVGITGANALTAEEGSVVIAHNEGNIFEVLRKRKHIIVTAIDKIYPNIEDAINMLKVICFNATGSWIPSFIEIISGVSKTADIEKKFIKGIHAPGEIVLILVDNKRTEIIQKGYKEILTCIDCGNCLLHCPMYNTVGNYFACGKNLGGKGIALSFLSDEEVEKKLELCLTCGHCRRNCPLEIDIPSIIRSLRSDNIPTEVYYFLKSHLFWLYYNLRLKLNQL